MCEWIVSHASYGITLLLGCYLVRNSDGNPTTYVIEMSLKFPSIVIDLARIER